MATGQEISNVMPLQWPIETRDGTLTTDSRMVNCMIEETSTGKTMTKRAGTSLQRQLPTGVSQAMCVCNLNPFAIINDTLYNVNTGAAIAIPGVTIPNQTYSVLSDAPVGTTMLKSSSGLWKFNGVTATKVTDPNFPPSTLAGIVELDGTYYVMDNGGTIWGSALNDPTTWPALNTIAPDVALGPGVALNRHLNYIEAFYQQGTKFYYDAGNSPGIPISPVLNASFTTGCADPFSVTETFDQTFFVSRSKEFGRSVHMFEGLALGRVSTPYIDKILSRSNMVSNFSYALKVNGHNFFLYTLIDLNLTIVYDTEMKQWYQWTSTDTNGNETHFAPLFQTATLFDEYFLEGSTGAVVRMNQGTFGDRTGPITVHIYTPNMNWGTLKSKRFAAMFLQGDTCNSTIGVQYTDDDYQSFSVLRNIDLSSVRKMLQRCGRSRQRAWHFVHTAGTALRLQGCEFDMSVGVN